MSGNMTVLHMKLRRTIKEQW